MGSRYLPATGARTLLRLRNARPQPRILRYQLPHPARVDCRGLNALFKDFSEWRTKTGAWVDASPGAKGAVVPARDVGEAGAVQVQFRRDEAELRPE
jgi:hypothetical protein